MLSSVWRFVNTSSGISLHLKTRYSGPLNMFFFLHSSSNKFIKKSALLKQELFIYMTESPETISNLNA